MDNPTRETEGKHLHDPLTNRHRLWVSGALIIGAGPSGLAVAACLKQRGIPSLILEKENCIASLWRRCTYDRLRLHLPKQFCELPILPFPPHFPTYPTKQEFIEYLETYAATFELHPVFDAAVVGAEYDERRRVWRVRVAGGKEYETRWVVVATGENAEKVEGEVKGRERYKGKVEHTREYKSGEEYEGKRVMVVGCGNSGMEVCLDLCNHGALPSLVVRDSVHVLPQQMLGTSTFGLTMCLLQWFPVHVVDKFLLLMSRIMLGDTSQLGLTRPSLGPMELKSISGKTPVLDIGTFAHIKSGKIKVLPEIKRLTEEGAEFVDGRKEKFDAIILATGYKSNVPSWLKGSNMFSEKDGYPVKPFPNGWKGENGLYAVGFTKRGLLGTSLDAKRIAQDIERERKSYQNNFSSMIHRARSE